MAAYVIVDVEIEDAERYAEYVRVVPPTIEKYGGRFLVRGGKAESLEGSWQPKRVVVLEFDSLERAKEWWASEEYARPKAMRRAASSADLIVVEGVR
jgi:uncharacterized protein (DUF1330 family)